MPNIFLQDVIKNAVGKGLLERGLGRSFVPWSRRMGPKIFDKPVRFFNCLSGQAETTSQAHIFTDCKTALKNPRNLIYILPLLGLTGLLTSRYLGSKKKTLEWGMIL
ncbi:MAG: hypothetical protein AAF621_02485 [Pseudomonadota bacterium]